MQAVPDEVSILLVGFWILPDAFTHFVPEKSFPKRLQNCLFHNITALETALEVRKNPQKYLESAELQALSGKLGNAIQQYADVLEKELKTTSFVGVCTF